jgi:hypothetical protein
VSLTLIYENFPGTTDLASPWTNVNGIWTQRAVINYTGPSSTYEYASGAAILANIGTGFFGGTAVRPMGKTILATNWFNQLAGDATNDKIAEVSCDLVWRFVPNATDTTFLGLIFAGTSSGLGGYAVLVTRTTSPTTTTGRLVKIDTTSSFASPTFTNIGGAAVTLPNATNGERWTLKARVTWFAPTFTIASILATFVDATGTNHVIGLPSGQNSATFGTNTGQGSLATWSAGQLYVGFLERDGSSSSGVSSSATIRVASSHQFERLRVRDVGPLANLTTSTPAYTFAPSVTYSAASVSTETNASAYSLAVQPSFSQETVDQWAVADFYSDSGDRVAFPLQTKRRRRWSFRWTALDDSEKATLATLNANVKGRFSTWSWTDPETAVAVNVRFTSDIEFQKIGPTAWSAAANVEEVL